MKRAGEILQRIRIGDAPGARPTISAESRTPSGQAKRNQLKRKLAELERKNGGRP
jgi:hypothetical protein